MNPLASLLGWLVLLVSLVWSVVASVIALYHRQDARHWKTEARYWHGIVIGLHRHEPGTHLDDLTS